MFSWHNWSKLRHECEAHNLTRTTLHHEYHILSTFRMANAFRILGGLICFSWLQLFGPNSPTLCYLGITAGQEASGQEASGQETGRRKRSAEPVQKAQRIHPTMLDSPVWLDLKGRLETSKMDYRLVCVDDHGRCQLVLARTKTRSLEPLRGASLDLLDISDTDVTDLTPLAGMKIRELWMERCGVTDLSPLKGLGLVTVSIRGNQDISDLTPLSNPKLEYLNLSGTGVTDLRPLARVPLVHVDMRQTGVRDISALAQSRLKLLQLEGSQVRDLSPLESTKVWLLSLSWCDGIDLAPLRHLPLVRLKLTGLGFENVSALSGMKLRYLELHNTKVIDLSPLRDMPLKELRLVDTPVADLLPLADLNLVELYLSEPGIDLRQITPIRLLWLRTPTPENTRHFETLRSHSTMRWIEVKGLESMYVPQFWKQYASQVASDNAADIAVGLGRLDVWIGQLSHEDAAVREKSARNIASLRSLGKRATPHLIQCLNDPVADVVRAVGDALEAIGPAATKQLVLGLKDEDSFIRHRCAYALSNIRPVGNDVVDGISALLSDHDERTRMYAAISLGNLGSVAAPAVGELVRRIQTDEKEVRRFAVEAVGKIGPDAVDAVGPLIDVLEAPKGAIFNAEVSLGLIGPPAQAAVPALLRRMRAGFMPSNIARALGRLGPAATPGLPDLYSLLDDDNNFLRRHARESIDQIEASQ